MITNKPSETVIAHSSNRQRLGNKTLFTNLVKNQNNVNVRYFSGIDAEIYFEDVYIDETVQIAFNVQQQAMPLYGYNSYVYDDIALGSRLVSGQFTINFTKSNYMYQVLDTLTAMKNNNQTTTVKNISSRAPLWNKTFDIYMSYGDAKQNQRVANSTILVLKKVSLTSCSQEIDYSGQPIYETYSFVAKDIDFLTEGEYIEQTTQKLEAVAPVTAAYFDPTNKDSMLLKFVFDPNVQIKSLAYKMTSMNFYESVYETDDEKTLKDTYVYQASKEASNLVYEHYNKNKGSIRISITSEFVDKNGNVRFDEQVFDIPKRQINM